LLAAPRPGQFRQCVAGGDAEAAVLLPVPIGELITALERLVGPDEVARQVDGWLERAARLTG
jgi:hypothetical protein